MNTAALARATYSNAATHVKTPRSIEYQAFAKITHRLAHASGNGFEGAKALISAVHDNRRLWTILAVDVADENNALPASLRAQIFYLSEFVQQYSGTVLSGQNSPAALVDINSAIMRGLRSSEGDRQ